MSSAPRTGDLPSSLAALSDEALIAEVDRMAADERTATARLLAALGELDDRRLYLRAGCSSMFTYCTQVLHLSEHAAYRRIQAARAARVFPGILDRLASGSLTLTAVGLLAAHLTAENHARVLDQAHQRSRAEIEQLVARLVPKADVAEMIRRLPAPRPSVRTAEPAGGPAAARSPDLAVGVAGPQHADRAGEVARPEPAHGTEAATWREAADGAIRLGHADRAGEVARPEPAHGTDSAGCPRRALGVGGSARADGAGEGLAGEVSNRTSEGPLASSLLGSHRPAADGCWSGVVESGPAGGGPLLETTGEVGCGSISRRSSSISEQCSESVDERADSTKQRAESSLGWADSRSERDPVDASAVAARVPSATDDAVPGIGRGLLAVGRAQAMARARPATVAPLTSDRFKVQFTIGAETHFKLRRVRDLMRHACPDDSLERVFDRAITLLLADLERTRLAAALHPREGERLQPPGSRHIPSAVKRAVWNRDQGRCAFAGTAGRCRETAFLQFHHRVPFAVGGEATVENIELRCASHNAFEADLFFGPGASHGTRHPSASRTVTRGTAAAGRGEGSLASDAAGVRRGPPADMSNAGALPTDVPGARVPSSEVSRAEAPSSEVSRAEALSSEVSRAEAPSSATGYRAQRPRRTWPDGRATANRRGLPAGQVLPHADALQSRCDLGCGDVMPDGPSLQSREVRRHPVSGSSRLKEEGTAVPERSPP